MRKKIKFTVIGKPANFLNNSINNNNNSFV